LNYTPETSADFVMLRRGVRDHILSGKLTFTQACVFFDLLLQADKEDGVAETNASIQSLELRQPKRVIQDAHWHLRRIKWIHYEDERGNKGRHPIYIDKYPCKIKPRRPGEPAVYYSKIWSPARSFIGRSLFLGRLKCAGIGGSSAFSGSLSGGLSISGFGLSMGFKLDFTAHFDEYRKAIDLLSKNDAFCEWLADFEGDFQQDFQGVFRGEPIHINILTHSKKTSKTEKDRKPTETEKHRMAELSAELLTINHGFKPDRAVGWAVREKYHPGQIIEAMEALAKRQRKEPPIENGFGYFKATLENIGRKGSSASILNGLYEEGQ
jgi:hypothetical protein